MSQTTTLHDGVVTCRDALNSAAWSVRWVDAEPKLRVARDALASELSFHLGTPMELEAEILYTALHEALQLVLSALSTGIQSDNHQRTVRHLIAEAIGTLDEVL